MATTTELATKDTLFTPAMEPTACRCGGRFQTGFTPDTETGELAGAVIHTLPTCPDFDKLEPTDFLRWVRGSMEN